MTHVSIPQNPPTRRTSTPPARIVLIGAAVVLGATAVAALGGTFSPAAQSERETRSHVQAADGAQTAHVVVQFGAGDLTLGALDASDSTLARMSFEGPSDLRPEPSYAIRSGVGELAYASPDTDRVWRSFPFVERSSEHADLQVQLAPSVPLALNIEAGAADSTLDLTQLRVTRLDLQTGASDTRVRLPQAAGSTVMVARAAVAQLDIEVPSGVAADIVVTNALGSRQINTARFEALGDGRYRSPEYATAANRVEMHLEVGIGDLSVR